MKIEHHFFWQSCFVDRSIVLHQKRDHVDISQSTNMDDNWRKCNIGIVVPPVIVTKWKLQWRQPKNPCELKEIMTINAKSGGLDKSCFSWTAVRVSDPCGWHPDEGTAKPQPKRPEPKTVHPFNTSKVQSPSILWTCNASLSDPDSPSFTVMSLSSVSNVHSCCCSSSDHGSASCCNLEHVSVGDSPSSAHNQSALSMTSGARHHFVNKCFPQNLVAVGAQSLTQHERTFDICAALMSPWWRLQEQFCFIFCWKIGVLEKHISMTTFCWSFQQLQMKLMMPVLRRLPAWRRASSSGADEKGSSCGCECENYVPSLMSIADAMKKMVNVWLKKCWFSCLLHRRDEKHTLANWACTFQIHCAKQRHQIFCWSCFNMAETGKREQRLCMWSKFLIQQEAGHAQFFSSFQKQSPFSSSAKIFSCPS